MGQAWLYHLTEIYMLKWTSNQCSLDIKHLEKFRVISWFDTSETGE